MLADQSAGVETGASSRPTADAVSPRDILQLTLVRHSLGWLAAGSLVGVWLAAELAWPTLGRMAGPLTYGRWMPLHTDWLLYGWSALPLVAWLLNWLPPPDRKHANFARAVIFSWSATLATGGIFWLTGQVSGKLFLANTGGPRLAFPLVLAALWSCLAAHLWHARRQLEFAQLAARSVLLILLLPVPAVLWAAGSAQIYPSVNPDSGGATGASLLGSTLAILFIVGLLAQSLVPGIPSRIFYRRAFAGCWLISAVVYLFINHGNVSHHDPAAIASLASLLIWLPILVGYLKSFQWGNAPLWRHALVAWWGLLAIDGVATFLPGVSERMKFTNGLVAHAHLAMAGFSTALCFVILQQLSGNRLRAILENRVAFCAWQLGQLVFVVAMLGLGGREVALPGVLFRADTVTTWLYGIRFIAGAAMATTAGWWFYRSLTLGEAHA